jgi:hypothetical protein
MVFMLAISEPWASAGRLSGVRGIHRMTGIDIKLLVNCYLFWNCNVTKKDPYCSLRTKVHPQIRINSRQVCTQAQLTE